MKSLREAMEQLRQEQIRNNKTEVFSVLRERLGSEKQTESEFFKKEINLTDIWPGLSRVLLQIEKLPSGELSAEAIDNLEEINVVINEVKSTHRKGKFLVRNFLKMLRLPFWKYRWRLYEVWILFKLIECLNEYDCRLESVAGQVLVEENKASKVAHFTDSNSSAYDIWTQLETTVARPLKRKHIMPDIRVNTGDARIPENTLLVIECKQRKQMETRQLIELVKDYRAGAKRSALLLFVNYDVFPLLPSKFPKTSLISKMSPANPNAIEEFARVITQTLLDNKIEPSIPQIDAILFDVSDSMRGEYLRQDIGSACERLIAENTRAKLFFFQNCLLSTEILSPANLRYKLDSMVGGSTNLDRALQELTERDSEVKRVVVVTDGGYSRPLASTFALYQLVEELVLGRNFPSLLRDT